MQLESVSQKITEETYDDWNDYLETEPLEGGIQLKVHPHCLTGAKGFETSYRNYDLNALKDEEEDLLANEQYESLLRGDSNQLSRYSKLSSSSKGVWKLALDTEEDEIFKGDTASNNTKAKTIQENLTKEGIDERRFNIVKDKDLFSNSYKTKNMYFAQDRENTDFMNSYAKVEISQKELDLVLMQSPEEVNCKNVELDKLDTEILITGEDNECRENNDKSNRYDLEVEEFSVFDQDFRGSKMFQFSSKYRVLHYKNNLNEYKSIQ